MNNEEKKIRKIIRAIVKESMGREEPMDPRRDSHPERSDDPEVEAFLKNIAGVCNDLRNAYRGKIDARVSENKLLELESALLDVYNDVLEAHGLKQRALFRRTFLK